MGISSSQLYKLPVKVRFAIVCTYIYIYIYIYIYQKVNKVFIIIIGGHSAVRALYDHSAVIFLRKNNKIITDKTINMLRIRFKLISKDNAIRKHNHYNDLCSELRNQYNLQSQVH